MIRNCSEYCLALILAVAVSVMFIPRPWINPTLFQAALFLLGCGWAIALVVRPFPLRFRFLRSNFQTEVLQNSRRPGDGTADPRAFSGQLSAVSDPSLLASDSPPGLSDFIGPAGTAPDFQNPEGISRAQPVVSFPMIPLACAVAWGTLQLAANWTTDRADTRTAVLVWVGNLVAFCLAMQVRRRFLDTLLHFAFALSVVSVVMYFRGGDPPTLGPFVNRDHYAAFIEMMLPLALVQALGGGPRSTGYAVVCAAMYASVIAGASRAGALLVTAEVVIVPLLMWAKRRPGNASGRKAAINVCGLALVFVAVVGWAVLWNRFQDADPFGGRREILSDTVGMIHARPWTGFGLGSFRTTYPAYASIDFGAVVHHAHNDWAEWAADGGIPFALLMLSIAVWSFPRAVRSVWGIGVVAAFVHATVDFPLQKPVLELWLFALLGVLATADPN